MGWSPDPIRLVAFLERESFLFLHRAGYREKVTVLRLGRESSLETDKMTPWSWTSILQNWRQQTFVVDKPPRPWYCTMLWKNLKLSGQPNILLQLLKWRQWKTTFIRITCYLSRVFMSMYISLFSYTKISMPSIVLYLFSEHIVKLFPIRTVNIPVHTFLSQSPTSALCGHCKGY